MDGPQIGPPPGPGEDDDGVGVRVLVVALVVQLVVAAVVVWFAVNGWPWISDPPARSATAQRAAGTPGGDVPARFLPAADDGVPTPRVDRFDAAAAFALLRRQVEAYGYRPAGSAASRRLAADLKARLPRGRYENVPGHPGLRNVVGVVPGRRPAIVVGAHYDGNDTPRDFVGANDGAAGTAAVVTLARALAARPARPGQREVRFVLFDGEEEPSGSSDFLKNGLRGSKAYVRAHPGEVGRMILLDYIANRGLRLPREGSSDPALWTRLRAAAARAGTLRSFPPGTETTIYDDHTPFLRAGIPAIDLIDWGYPWVHVADDDLSKVSARSLDVTGETVMDLLLRERAR